MLIDKFELIDNVDYWYRDLVILKEPMLLEDVQKLVQDVKERVGITEYTYDDILKELEKISKEIIDLYTMEKVYY